VAGKSTIELRKRLSQGDVLILDGAFGTELERMRAISTSPIWSAEVIDTREELVVSIHKDYIGAGADIITTGTFRTTKRTLAKVGRAREYEKLSRNAVALARQAIQSASPSKTVYIAGSIAPLEDCYLPSLVPPDAECRKEHRIQAEILASAGVDIILCETFNTVREGVAALEAAVPLGLPVFLSFTTTSTGNLLSGEDFQELQTALGDLNPDCLMINCTPTQTLHISLERLITYWTGPIGAYGNVGNGESIRWDFTDDISASSYLGYAKRWVSLGAQVVGGCCGTNPDYIRHLRYHLPEKIPIPRFHNRT
jgi:S-methylmethionine-dependent homocysteine/selenocysteine methylase